MSISISDAEFHKFQKFVYQHVGIHLHAGKKALVCGRLGKRLQYHQCHSYGAYFDLMQGNAGERQICIDLLTTNETYFFREPKHFEWLQAHVQALPATCSTPLRIWSAASSSGEEAYSIAMLLDEHCRSDWEVMGSDISTRVLETARVGHYNMARAHNIPQHYLKRCCLKGMGSQEGTFLIRPSLRECVEFLQINLNEPMPAVGRFDIIFLRNVMIYFDTPTKERVVHRLLDALLPGGYLCIGHSESLNDFQHPLQSVAPAIFRKPSR